MPAAGARVGREAHAPFHARRRRRFLISAPCAFGLALLLLLRPLAEDAPVFFRKPRRGVQRQVGLERHLARLDLLAHLVELALALAPRVGRPLGERKLPAPLDRKSTRLNSSHEWIS